MDPKRKVAIIGAGPGGIETARELARSKFGDSLEITIYEQGKKIEDRTCPANGSGKECIRCQPYCHIRSGEGGAGLKSDGKLIYHPSRDNNLLELCNKPEPGRLGEQELKQIIDNRIESEFQKRGIPTEKRNLKAEQEMLEKAAQYGIEFIPAKQTHVGSDRLPKIMQEIVSDLEKKVKINTQEEIVDFKDNVLISNKGEHNFDYLVFATGRNGLFERLVDKKGIDYIFNPVDIGIRVEVPAEVMKRACEISWDFKAKIITPTYQDEVRTFCVCPNGYVTQETHKDFCLVNGEAKNAQKSKNTNFAFLVKYRPTAPVTSGNELGRIIAQKAGKFWDGKIGLQRLGDLRRGQRSTWDRINKYSNPKPTLLDVCPGDLGSGLDYRNMLDILEGFEILNHILPGVNQDSTLLYAPEIKFHGIQIVPQDNYLQTNIPYVYAIGDGAGTSRGITGAMLSGIIAARGIIRDLKEN